MQQRAWALVPMLTLFGCVPELDTDESVVAAPRVLAVSAEPAEAAPGQQVVYRALVADARGTRADLAPIWFQCLAQKPLAELGPVSPACLRADSGRLAPLGMGTRVSARLPTDACALFGPNPPPPVADQSPGRPVDPDESGGYRLPVVVGLGAGEGVTLYEQRITCGLAGVDPALSVAYATRYHANQNPTVTALGVVEGGAVRALASGALLEVATGARVELEVAWPGCPDSDVCGDGVCGPDETASGCSADCAMAQGCGGQERYVVYDRAAQALTARREALRLAFYATRGRYEEERTGAAADDARTASRNVWYAPAEPTVAILWVVLRDARGGVGYREQTVIVR